MIDRYHFFKLVPACATPAGRAEVVARLREVLPAVPGVVSVTAGVPADADGEAAWDVSLVVRFRSLADAAAYRAHPVHRRFADEYMAPRIEVKKAWNFEVG
jgi:hypothetical protein